MGGGQGHHGDRGVTSTRPGGQHPYRRVGVQHDARPLGFGSDAGPDFPVVEASPVPPVGQGGVLDRVKLEVAGGPKVVQLGTHRRAVTAVHLEQQALQVGRNLDVHAGRRGGYHLGEGHRPLSEEPGEDVIGVAAHHQLGHSQTG